MKSFLHSSLALTLLLLPALAARGEVKLPAIISDHMVLQQGKAVPIWGWADPGEKVVVEFAEQTKTATAKDDGSWSVTLDALHPGKPATMSIKGTANEIKIEDVLVGEVWLGSGQSNMAMTVNRAKDFENEQKLADLPQVRMFTERSGSSNEAQKIGSGTWLVCSPTTVAGFSATLFFFGRELHNTLDVPVGLINSSVGGTPIENWIDAEVQRADDRLKPFFESAGGTQNKLALEKASAQYQRDLEKYRIAVAQAKADGKPLPKAPVDPVALRAKKGNIGGLFNGKIAPLIPFTIRGAIWYQGEANSTPEKAPYYQHQLSLLITDWRKRWGEDFPFAWAQLPNFSGPGRDWPTVREAMLKTLVLPYTGMGINIDIGETNDIHPKNKQEVGRRLSLWALGSVYQQKVAAISGPVPDGFQIEERTIVLSFKHAAGLKAKGGELTGFEISEDGENWQPADAKIDGERVIVSHSQIAKPSAARYGWANDPQCNLYNGADLPASPFRTGE